MSRDNGMGMELVVERATWSAGWRGEVITDSAKYPRE